MTNELLDSALEYARMGFKVFPVEPGGKRPHGALAPKGFYDATSDEEAIKLWWEFDGNANIGIRTGAESGGIFVIDIDRHSEETDGQESLKDWQIENGSLPETCQSITANGGYHMLFKSSRKVSNATGIIPSVDIRGDGGYIVAPPSVIRNTIATEDDELKEVVKRYEWEYPPDEYKIAEADHIVMELVNHRTKVDGKSEPFKMPEQIMDHTRNDTLFRLACSLQAKGLSDEGMLAAVRAENNGKCELPVDDDELLRIIKSSLKYEKGTSQIASGEKLQRSDTFEEFDCIECEQEPS